MAEINDDEMFSMSYKDARDKYAVGVGSSKYFMSESDFNKRKERINKKNAEKQSTPNKEEKAKPKEQSLVAEQFGDSNSKNYDDVLRENGNDPEKMANWLNNNPGYKAGSRTKAGMEGFGYSQGADGKWTAKPKTETKTTTPTTETKTTTETNAETKTTTDDALNGIETITKEDPKAKGFVDGVTNEDGGVNEQKAYNAMSQYEQKMVEMGAGYFDEDGKFVFKDTTKKGWEDWATMLSVGASVIGLALGVPIMPINFRKITNKDEKDAKIREFQKQYTDIMAGNAAKVSGMNADVEAGNIALKNRDALTAQEKHAQATAAQKDVINAQKDAEKELIDEKLKAEMALVDAEFKNKIGEMELSHEQRKELEELMSSLSTDSAKELLNQERYKYLIDMAKDMKDAGMDEKAIALKIQSLAGKTATAQNLEHASKIVGMITSTLESIGSAAGSFLGKGKDK